MAGDGFRGRRPELRHACGRLWRGHYVGPRDLADVGKRRLLNAAEHAGFDQASDLVDAVDDATHRPERKGRADAFERHLVVARIVCDRYELDRRARDTLANEFDQIDLAI